MTKSFLSFFIVRTFVILLNPYLESFIERKAMPIVELTTNTDEAITPVLATFVPPSTKAKFGIIYPPPEVRSKFFSLIS